MIKFALENIRRLRATPFVQLRPLNLLVGRNSSGKSTFLRSIPLISQSMQTSTSGAVLWWGDMVDFGSFRDARRNPSESEDIIFKFSIDDVRVRHNGDIIRFSSDDAFELPQVDLTVVLSVKEGESPGAVGETYVSRFIVRESVSGLDIMAYVDSEGGIQRVVCEGKDEVAFVNVMGPRIIRNSILPRMFFRVRASVNQSNALSNNPSNFFIEEMSNIIQKYCHGRTARGTIEGYARRVLDLGVYSKERFEAEFGAYKGESGFVRFTRRLIKNSDRKTDEALARMSALAYLSDIVTETYSRLGAIFGSVFYIGPARARSERYYRRQDLSVSKIAPDGTNFPLFLASLSRHQLSMFSSLVAELYGYNVRIKQSDGHISILLSEQEGIETNLVDTGYGVSQILPVLGQMWWASSSSERMFPGRDLRGTRLVAIEQPELHLHPAHQSRLADAFAAFINDRHKNARQNKEVLFLVETHSESLVNRLGELIFNNELRKEDIQILIFEECGENSAITEVTVAEFDDQGALINWPVGFFGG